MQVQPNSSRRLLLTIEDVKSDQIVGNRISRGNQPPSTSLLPGGYRPSCANLIPTSAAKGRFVLSFFRLSTAILFG